MIDEILISELTEIVVSHKKKFLQNSKQEHNPLLNLSNNLLATSPAASNLKDEMVDVANNYITQKGVVDSDEIKSFIQDFYLDFSRWCLIGK